jgi:uncharacterized protein YegL
METIITVILDASGSMEALTEQTISGLNSYLADRKADQFKMGGSVKISILAFDSVREYREGVYAEHYRPVWLYRNRPVQEVQPITKGQYRPFGGTPLYDAIKDAITDLQSTSCDHNRNLVVIITDGEENTSKTTRAEVLELISKKQNENFTFVYLGANQDSFKAAGGIGIYQGNIANYGVHDTSAVYASMSNVTRGLTSSSLKKSANVMSMSIAEDGTSLGNAVDASGNIIVDSSSPVSSGN